MPDNPTTPRMVPASLDPCLEKRELDEPMFILLARDSAAPLAIETWCNCREAEIARGLRPDTTEEWTHIKQVRGKVGIFMRWRKEHRS
jgi:hypothetical protein